MPLKLSGKDLTSFLASLEGDFHIDEDRVSVNGIFRDDWADVADRDLVNVHYGTIVFRSGTTLDLIKTIKNWQRHQSHARLVVEVPMAKVEAVREAVIEAGGKILA